MSNTFDKMSVLDSFIEEVNSYLPDIETNLDHLAQLAQETQATSDMDAIEETYRRTHTIGGSASMMDFPGLAHVAHGMEDILGDALESIIVLDSLTIALLQRSLGRLHRLLSGIRSGINEDAVIAEDDADYMQYRTFVEASLQNIPASNNSEAPSTSQATEVYSLASTPSFDEAITSFRTSIEAPQPNVPVSNNSIAAYTPQGQETFPITSMPSFDEVLASFRTSASLDGDNTVWPEEPMPLEVSSASSPEEQQPVAQSHDVMKEPAPPTTSALDTLVASTRQTSPSYFAPANTSVQSYTEAPVTNFSNEATIPMTEPNRSLEAEPFSKQESQSSIIPAQKPALPVVYNDVQEEARALTSYASSLKDVSSQLHTAITIIEEQRSEFKGFLDGSKDALDRMEEWAGQAMGLNLKNSPEQVRRYLPLSVMWVSNSKLKKILEYLKQITSGVELTDEQMQSVLAQLTSSITSFGEAFQDIQAQQANAQQPAWTPWEMQAEQEANHAIQERVTFERFGNLDSIRAEIEAHVREEMQREYEYRSIATNAARAELEQQLRQEIRQEFEQKRYSQDQALNNGTDALRAELEQQLRDEIEIKVRQEFLNQIAENADAASGSLALPTPPTPTTSNFADRALQSTGASEREEQPVSVNKRPTPSNIVTENVTMVQPTTSAPAQKVAMAANTDASEQSASFTSPMLGGDFGEEAAEIFRLEAEEHLQTISTYVAALEKDPTNRDLIQGIRRATHTLKGAAAMMGFRAIAELSHVSEDLLDNIMEGKTTASSDAVSLILDTAETLDVLITGNRGDTIPDEVKVQALRARYANLLADQGIALSAISEDIDEDSDESEEPAPNTPLVSSTLAETPGTNVQHGNRDDLSVRVRLQKLDELVNLFGELLVNRSVLEERLERLVRLVADVGISSNRLRDVGQKLESRFEAATLPSGRSVTVMPGDGMQPNTNSKNGTSAEPSHLADFDALEMDRYTEFHQVARGLSEGISDMATLSTEMDVIIRECENVFARENRLSTAVQDRLMKTRLVPLSTMTPRLYRAARAVALKQHKEFEFLLEGEETEIDRTVFEEIAGPLLHLVRNAVNHGIETEAERVQRGKSPVGQLKLAASYEGNQVVITVREDGKGIEPETVRRVAIEHGLIKPDHVLSENELIELIFRPGFSTAEVLSEESGRGVGLDVVRDSVSRLRGTIEVESTPGKGTAFTMKFPTSLAIQSAMMVRVSDQQFAIPIVTVESIGRLDTFKRTTVAGQPAVIVRNDLYPLSMLSQYLSLPQTPIDDKSHVLLVNTGGNRVALVIDEVKGKLDIVMKNLGPHLRHIHGIAGGTVLGNGQVVLVLELTELLSTRNKVLSSISSGTTAQEATTPMPQTPSSNSRIEGSPSQQTRGFTKLPTSTASKQESGKHILVVDDSPSVRRVVGNMLKQHNWEVQMARDGVEALEMIGRETPAAVLLDVEMPRMDGYELIATIRAQEQYRTLPLIMLTSRAAAKHQQRAMQLGASAYLVKPYQDDELLNILNSHVYGAMVS